MVTELRTTACHRNAVERAIDHVEETFGSPGKEALIAFFNALPSCATITWTYSAELLWAPTALLAMQLEDDIANG